MTPRPLSEWDSEREAKALACLTDLADRAYAAGAAEMRERCAARVECMIPDPSESARQTVRKGIDWIAAWVSATAMAVRAIPLKSEGE